MNILAIESSCDETSAAIVKDGTTILSNIIATSHDMHEKYGGIVPEVAARKQLESILAVITEALGNTDIADIDALAVTIGPGLIGSLLVGVETAKTLAALLNKPLIPVNHVMAHMYANLLTGNNPLPQFPAISLVVSGGHTELYKMDAPNTLTWLGGTIDDAAGECFDKTARLLGFGNGGGPAIEAAARLASGEKNHQHQPLPRPMLPNDHYLDFSFSGLKTAIAKLVHQMEETHASSEKMAQMLSFEVQEAICDVLVKKTLRAVSLHAVKSVFLSGGVSANTRLREKLKKALSREYPSITLHVPPISLCTDNAAYIGSYAYFAGKAVPWESIEATPDLSVEAFVV